MTEQAIKARYIDQIESAIKSGSFTKCFGTVQGALVIGLMKECGLSDDTADRVADAIFEVYLKERYPNS